MKQIETNILFNYSVADILNGENTAYLSKEISNAVYGKTITFVYDTYPFIVDGKYQPMEIVQECNAMTYGQLVMPICKELQTIAESGQFDTAYHDLDGVWIEKIIIDDDVVSIELGS